VSDRDRLSICAAAATMLTSTSLFSVFLGARWVPALVGVITVVAGCSAAARRLRLPTVLGPVLIIAGVTGYVTALFAANAAVAGVLPGPGAVRMLRARANEGFADIHALAPPVPTHPGLILITVVGVALVALAADVAATTLRQPPAAGLPLLALFAVPATVSPTGGGVVPFALAVSGYMLLLAADGRTRLARWGRSLRPTGQLAQVSRLTAASYGEEPPTGAMGRRIGLTAIGLALVVPVALPVLRPPLFAGVGTGVGPGRGGNSVITYNPIVRLHDELTSPQATPLLTLRTNELEPIGYLRMAGLDVFDGRTWAQSPLRASPADRVSEGQVLPPPPRRGATVTTAIQVSDRLDARWLPLPYQPTAIRISGDWRYDNRTGTVFSTRSNTRGRSYQVVSSALEVDTIALNSAELSLSDQAAFGHYTAYPADLPSMIKATADAVVAKAHATTPYQQAKALQQFFRSGAFTYSLKVPAGNSDNAIVNFLEVKQGFCEQFAATMALFARMRGIPARVAVGFTYGEQAPGGEHVITTHDAHAWPELYFSKAGWLPFEPTPVAGRGQAVAPSYTTGAITGGTAAGGGSTRHGTPQDPEARRFGNRQESSTSGPLPAEGARGNGSSRIRLLGWLGLLPVLLTVPAAVRATTRRRRWRTAGSPTGAAHAAWADLRDDARDVGLAWPASASPRGVASWLRSRLELSADAASALDTLVRAEERARYQRGWPGNAVTSGGDHALLAELRAYGATLRVALQGQVSGRRRWRARLLPASGTDRLRLLTSKVAMAGDRYDRNVARWTRSVFRRRPPTPYVDRA
jgi:transglutaminase-like putative cysteine protease